MSNAKTLILESKLLAKGVLKTGEQLNPETFSTARSVAETEIEEALVELEAVETDLEIPDSETTANLMMLAAVTKEIVEGGNLDIVQSSTETAAKTNAAKFLLEIARESKDFSASFSNKLAGRINEVVTDLNTNLKGAFKTSVSDAIKSVDKDKATTALKTDFKIVKEFLAGQFYRISDAEIGSQKASILLTYEATGGSDVVTMTVQQTVSNQGGTERLLTLFGGTPTIVFSYDDKPTSLKLVSIGSADINTYIGKLKIGETVLLLESA